MIGEHVAVMVVAIAASLVLFYIGHKEDELAASMDSPHSGSSVFYLLAWMAVVCAVCELIAIIYIALIG